MANQALRGGALIERSTEVLALVGAFDSLESGVGAVVALEGPAGIGKTRLLEQAGRLSAERGLAVLDARGSPVEQQFAFGLLRQLLERRVVRTSERERRDLGSGAAEIAVRLLLDEIPAHSPEVFAEPTFGLLNGVYWLVSNLAQIARLVLLVDDAHVGDEPTLRALSFLAERIRSVPVLLVVAARSGATDETSPVFELARLAGEGRISLRSLSLDGVRELAERTADRPIDTAAARACLRVTGGNPFLVEQLVLALLEAGAQIDEDGVALVSERASESLSRAVIMRLGSLGADAVALARAVAVLGERAELHHAGALAGISLESATAAAAALTRARVLVSGLGTELEFAHPLTRSAVYQDSTAPERRLDHRRAAGILLDAEDPAGRVASHLLLSDPAGEEPAARVLLAAGRQAVTQGALAEGVAFLRAALAERASGLDRPAMLLELGAAELGSGDHASAAEHLRGSLAGALDDREHVRRTVLLSQAIGRGEGFPAATQLLDAELGRLADREPELSLLIESEIAYLPYFDSTLVNRIAERYARYRSLPGSTPGQRAMLANLALRHAWQGGTACEVADLARRAFGDGALMREQGVGWAQGYFLCYVVLLTDELDILDHELASITEQAQAIGDPSAFVMGTSLAAIVAFQRGDVRSAEAEAVTAEHAADQLASSPVNETIRVAASALQILPHLERGELDLAQQACERAGLGDGPIAPDDIARARMVHHRAALRLVQGRFREALADARIAGEHIAVLGIDDPGNPWRALASAAHVRLGEHAEAVELADECVESAQRWGAPSILGAALLARALADPPPGSVGRFRAAIDALAASPAALELARARGHLGTVLLRQGRRSDGQALLREAVDGAARCGAIALVERLHSELQVAGARPRRLMFSGVESLTASERRIATMAADGRTNREIAQALFVTLKTVEAHLGSVFRKLDISSRRDLAAKRI